MSAYANQSKSTLKFPSLLRSALSPTSQSSQYPAAEEFNARKAPLSSSSMVSSLDTSQSIPLAQWLRSLGLLSRLSLPVYVQVDSQDTDNKECPNCGTTASSDLSPLVEVHRENFKSGIWWSIFVFCSGISLFASYHLGRYTAASQLQATRLKSDVIFPNVPLTKVRWINDERFMETDPLRGRFWANKEGEWTVWDEIHRGSWIQITPSPADDITGGLPLNLYSSNGSWPNGKEGYIPSVLHQLHCVGTLNHWKLKLRAEESLSEGEIEHMGHCIEYLRQAVMCFGDTALEKPVDHSIYVHADFEETEHLCRDWHTLSQYFWASSIDFIWGTDSPMTVFENSDAWKGNPAGSIL